MTVLTRPPDPKLRPHWRLVVHDIRLALRSRSPQVIATVECEIWGRTVSVERVCTSCARFARVEPHEAGYLVLCRSADEELSEPNADDRSP